MSNKLTYVLSNGSNYKQSFDLNSYDDRMDVSPEISLFEYGILRQSKTGKVLFWNKTLEHEKIEKSGYVTVSNISLGDVIECLKGMDVDFFTFIGSTYDKEIKRFEENPDMLSNIIYSINQWNGWFYS